MCRYNHRCWKPKDKGMTQALKETSIQTTENVGVLGADTKYDESTRKGHLPRGVRLDFRRRQNPRRNWKDAWFTFKSAGGGVGRCGLLGDLLRGREVRPAGRRASAGPREALGADFIPRSCLQICGQRDDRNQEAVPEISSPPASLSNVSLECGGCSCNRGLRPCLPLWELGFVLTVFSV